MQWEVVIGLETHVQLSTKTKIFSAASTDFGAEPNTHACCRCKKSSQLAMSSLHHQDRSCRPHMTEGREHRQRRHHHHRRQRYY